MASIIIKDDSTLRKLEFSTIYYIQSHPQKPHIVLIVTGQGNYSLRASLTSILMRWFTVIVKHWSI